MTLSSIKIEIDVVIQNINRILSEEDFSAYHKVKKHLQTCSTLLDDNKPHDTKKPLLLSIRLLMEAPTNDKELGLDTLKKVDSIYKKISSLEA